MSKTIPEHIRKSIVDSVFAKADEYRYLDRTRIENGLFMENLVKDPNVGQILLDYLPQDKVKTYIKDAVLNRYAKVRKPRPRSVNETLNPLYDEPIHEIDYRKNDGVSLHRLESGELVVVARTTLQKWETGLRKMVLYVASAPGLPPADGKSLDLVLIIYQHQQTISESDQDLIRSGLRCLGVKCVWA